MTNLRSKSSSPVPAPRRAFRNAPIAVRRTTLMSGNVPCRATKYRVRSCVLLVLRPKLVEDSVHLCQLSHMRDFWWYSSNTDRCDLAASETTGGACDGSCTFCQPS